MSRHREAVIGDLHLAKLKRLIPNHLALQISCLHFIMRRVVDEGIKRVIFLGDTFDAPIVDLETVKALMEFIKTYPDVEFVWICGNHDRESLTEESHIDFLGYISDLGGLPNLRTILEPTKAGVVSYLPYPHNKALSKTRVAYAHCDRPNARRDNGNLIHCDTEWNEKIRFVIGHNHTSQTINLTDYLGTPWQCNFGEKPEKFWGIVEYDDDPKAKKLGFKMRRIPILLPYTLLNVKIDKASDFDEIKAAPIYYKLTIEPGVKLPKDFLATHSNCQLVGKVMQRIEVQEKASAEGGDAPINLTYKLPDYLKSRGLSKKQVKVGNKMVSAALSQLGISIDGSQGLTQ